MHSLEEIKMDDVFVGIRILCGNRMVCELKHGISLMITTMYANIGKDSSIVQGAFLRGIVVAMGHCAITGSIPVAMVG